MDTKLDFKVQTDNYKVIGHGEMIYVSQQIGEWWGMLAEHYPRAIPPGVQKEMFALINSGEEVQGFLILEDMRIIEARRKRDEEKKRLEEERKEAIKQTTIKTAEDLIKVMGIGLRLLGNVLMVLGVGVAFIVSAILSFDPILVAVLPDGRWIQCGDPWFD